MNKHYKQTRVPRKQTTKATKREPSTMRTDKEGKTYETVAKERRCSSRIYRTDKVFYRGRPTLVAIPTDDFCNWKTLVETPKYDHHRHHNKEESNKSYHSIIKYYI
jgi:hypothetical protein